MNNKRISNFVVLIAVLAITLMVLTVFVTIEAFPYYFFQTLDMHIWNYDPVDHNVTVKIFSGGRKIFERTYIIKPELSKSVYTNLMRGEYVIEINLDGKVYRYKAKVEPSFRFLIGGSFISFKIKNSSVKAVVLSEGPPRIEIVEFTNGSIFKKKFLFLEIYKNYLPSLRKRIVKNPTYRFDREDKIIYLKKGLTVNDSLKAIVGVVTAKNFPALESSINSCIKPVYGTPYSLKVDGLDVKIIAMDEYGTVIVHLSNKTIKLYPGMSWLITTKKRERIYLLNNGFLDKKKGIMFLNTS